MKNIRFAKDLQTYPPKMKLAQLKKRCKLELNKPPIPLPENSVVRDLSHNYWKVGCVIGIGGTGVICLGQENSDLPVNDSAGYVIKMELMASGSLFCEKKFYSQVGDDKKVMDWITDHHLPYLGIPKFVQWGWHKTDAAEYRFVVMKKYGFSVQEKLGENGGKCPDHTVFLIGLRLMDILEYIHIHGFTHGDIKASNMVVDLEDNNKVYLIDYGHSCRYILAGKHIEYTVRPEAKHYGTILFMSRDAHNGVSRSRRSDMESLGYCMLQWISSALPWKSLNKNRTSQEKAKYMMNIPSLLRDCLLLDKLYHDELKTYLEHVADLSHEDAPVYDEYRLIFKDALKKLGYSETADLDFTF